MTYEELEAGNVLNSITLNKYKVAATVANGLFHSKKTILPNSLLLIHIKWNKISIFPSMNDTLFTLLFTFTTFHSCTVKMYSLV